MNIYDFAILGGGIMGISIATKLTKYKGSRVALFEKRQVGQSGATLASGGFIRAFDFNPYHSLLALISFPVHEKRKREMDFCLSGHVYIIPAEFLHKTTATLKLFLKHGYPFDVLNVEEAIEIAPELSFEESDVVIWEPNAGYASPKKMAQVLKQEFLEYQGQLFEDTCVMKLEMTPNGKTIIHTDKRAFSAKKVITCLGAWNRSFMAKHSNIACENKLIELIGVAFNKKPQRCFNDFESGLYSKPLNKMERLIGIPQDVMNIDPEKKRSYNASFFKNHSQLINSKIKDYNFDKRTTSVVSADSYTKAALPEIISVHNKWTVVTGMNGAGFKFYPAISEYVCSIVRN